MQFTKATRKRAKLRLAISGPSGSGKTWGALKIAKGIGGRIAVIDTERGSASLYSDLVDFDALELNPPYPPEKFIEAIRAAEQAKYDILIIDSMTHEWDGAGGVLELNDQIAATRFRGNSWAAWNEMTPRHRAFVDAILQSPCHVICTMRSKTETVQGDDKKIKKLGMKAVQRDGTDYEFSLVFDLEHGQHLAVASKDRTQLFPEAHRITEETGRRLLTWLECGEPNPDPAPRQAPPQQHQQPQPQQAPPTEPVYDGGFDPGPTNEPADRGDAWEPLPKDKVDAVLKALHSKNLAWSMPSVRNRIAEIIGRQIGAQEHISHLTPEEAAKVIAAISAGRKAK